MGGSLCRFGMSVPGRARARRTKRDALGQNQRWRIPYGVCSFGDQRKRSPTMARASAAAGLNRIGCDGLTFSRRLYWTIWPVRAASLRFGRVKSEGQMLTASAECVLSDRYPVRRRKRIAYAVHTFHNAIPEFALLMGRALGRQSLDLGIGRTGGLPRFTRPPPGS